jgi:YggT family protein
MNDAGTYVVRFLLDVISFLFVVRFLLQACRVDFYNPIAQGFIKATDLVLKPIRRLLPGYQNLDFASLVAAILALIILSYAISALVGRPAPGFVPVLGSSVIGTATLIVQIFWWSILAVILASFIAPGNTHPVLNLLRQITEPLLAPARRLLPAMGGLDFSPILVFLLLGVIQNVVLPQLAQMLF